LEESVRDDLKALKAHPLLRTVLKNNVQGYVYDIKTGILKEIL
jgi:carbonic anhydrase